ncbi:hypothetical protein PIB30_000597 [Stylosanthes scabra]|uniref:Membrane-associated kinase regulator 2 n=1 Tax=Stylosanthes scabra TaxID=79078 RepID=A0ABU6X2G2_9FABA|nr:hypothetical protein [Stylosanthes scabra]
MDAFTFLRYWRSAGGEPPLPPPPLPASPETTHDDDGPFIDLEFMPPEDDDDDDGHITFTLSPSSNNHSNSPPTPPPPFTASFLKSATKFRVFMLGLKKPKPNSTQTQQGKLCTVDLKVEEVPILSLFTARDNNTSKPRASSDNKHESLTHTHTHSLSSSSSSSSEEKRSMNKYLRMLKVKPLSLYIRVSRSRCNEKLNQGEEPDEGSKHLGKSRSASAAVLVPSGRRDDSLLQQHDDGVQGAILHCKRSFNSTTECESSHQLPRSISNPLHET